MLQYMNTINCIIRLLILWFSGEFNWYGSFLMHSIYDLSLAL